VGSITADQSFKFFIDALSFFFAFAAAVLIPGPDSPLIGTGPPLQLAVDTVAAASTAPELEFQFQESLLSQKMSNQEVS